MGYAIGGAAATKTSPNNAKCVVWAISEFFYSFLLLFWILRFIAYIMVIYEICDGRGGVMTSNDYRIVNSQSQRIVHSDVPA